MRSLIIGLSLVLSASAFAEDNLELLSKIFPSAQQRLFKNLKNQDVNPSYEFDAGRTPEQALKEGLGGRCNTHAQVAAFELMQKGIKAEDLRIVSAVNDSSLDRLCLGNKGKSANEAKDGLSGHVFLLLKSSGKWYLVNTTTVPGTPPAKPFGKLGLELVPFISPADLDKQMQAAPVSIPKGVTGSLPPSVFGPMTIFQSIRPDQYPLHNSSDRRKLIASGSLTSDICRYDGSAHLIETPQVGH